MPRHRNKTTALWILIVVVFAPCAVAADNLIPVGAAKLDVTPRAPVVLAGYGGRAGPYEGIDNRLWVRAMAIGDAKPVVIIAIDNCGVPRNVTERLAKRLSEHGIAGSRMIIAATHTHNAPSLTGYAPILWQGRTSEAEDRATADYTTFAVEKMEEAALKAIANRKPMTLQWARGRVAFGGNRRTLSNQRWTGFGFQRSAPVDHSLPVIAARDADGTVRVVWANYACHCTTVGSRNFVGGDWAGSANASMEKAFPKAVTLTTIGCGADIGPQPSGNQQIADRHGQAIADEVQRLLADSPNTLRSSPVATRKRVQLPLADPKSAEHWRDQLKASGFHHQLAKFILKHHEETGAIPSEVDYPVSVWKFGDELALVFLAGEVVVDYSVRLNHELDWRRLWLTAWANEMPGYIPSKRVLAEGGYEADFSQVYYGQPGRYAEGVEDIVVAAVKELVGPSFIADEAQQPAPFHVLPSNEPKVFAELAKSTSKGLPKEKQAVLERLRTLLPDATAGVEQIDPSGGEATEWYNFAGDFTVRQFIRQRNADEQLSWRTPKIRANAKPLTLCFSGGVGWESEPKTNGFLLLLPNTTIPFDVTREPARWASKDGKAELVYWPTWTSNVDSAGFFVLLWNEPKLDDASRVQFSVRSLGSGSKRWFAVDVEQKTETRLKQLRAALLK